MKTCLIVEDNEISREVYEHHVDLLGFKSIKAKDAIEALEKCKESMPEVIILDWHMPDMDGFEFIVNLKKLENYSDPTIIMCTCDEKAQIIDETTLHSGIKGFLAKPTYFKDLENKFSELKLI